MSSSAESTLGMTFDKLREKIALQMGIVFPLPTADEAEVDSIIDSGVKQFYWPPAIEDVNPGRKWTFLRILKTGETVSSGVSTFVLPDDYGGGLTTIESTALDAPSIPIMDRSEFERQKVGGTTPTGTPKSATIYVSAAASNTESERYTVELFPQPDANLTLAYEYDIIPDAITTSVDYPFGAQLHSETILASCLAILEMRGNEGEPGPFYGTFVAQLKTSIALDDSLVIGGGRESLHPTTAPSLTTLASDYNHLRATMGAEMGFGYNPQTYTFNEQAQINEYMLIGLRQFYWPIAVPGDRGIHDWSFLRPVTTLATVASQEDYDLPIAVGSVLGTFTYSTADRYPDIIIVPEQMIRSYRSSNVVTTSFPTHAAVRSKSDDATGENVFELMLWPKPDAVYTLKYQYNLRPDKITATNLYTFAGPEHGETLREACLSAIEDDPQGKHYTKFIALLAASIARDKAKSTPEYFGQNGDGFHHHGHNHGNCLPFRTTTVTYDGIQY